MRDVRKLSCLKNIFGHISVITNKDKRVSDIDAFKVACNRKQIPLCKKHHHFLHTNRINLDDLDSNYLKK